MRFLVTLVHATRWKVVSRYWPEDAMLRQLRLRSLSEGRIDEK